jgi:hypothetical protein
VNKNIVDKSFSDSFDKKMLNHQISIAKKIVRQMMALPKIVLYFWGGI